MSENVPICAKTYFQLFIWWKRAVQYFCLKLRPRWRHWPQSAGSPVARHFRGSVAVPSCADGGPAKLRMGVLGLVKTYPAVAMFGALLPCPRTRLGIHLETDETEISKDANALYIV